MLSQMAFAFVHVEAGAKILQPTDVVTFGLLAVYLLGFDFLGSLTHGQMPCYQVSVRQASVLPPASFRPNVAIGALSLAVRLPL